MDYKKITENWLRNYNDILIQLDAFKELYTEVEEHIKNDDAICYDKDKLSPSYKFSSDTENKAIELATLQNKINHLENKVLVINQGIKKMDEKERRIIELRYMQLNKWDRPLTWMQISRQMNYDISWCKELNHRAINTLTKVMFGEIQDENPQNTRRFSD